MSQHLISLCRVGRLIVAVILIASIHVTVQAQVSPGCYTIKNVQSGQFIQAMSDNTVQHVSQASGQDNQIWRLESADGKLRISSVLGSDKVMYVDALSNDQPVRLGGDSPGNSRYRWVTEFVSGNSYRVRAENKPWDQGNAGSLPTLQIWGDATAESLPQTYNWERFEFQSANCSGPPNGNYLTASPSGTNVGASGGNQTINISSNVNWSVSSNAGWLTYNPGNGSNSGSTTLTAQANSGSARTGVATISGGGLAINVTVYQDGTGGGTPPATDLTNIQGYVGINTLNNGGGKADGDVYRLAVKGKILAEEIRVRSGWADFVFMPGYKLPSLATVETHIKEKGHLPGIPSAEQVQAHGIDVGVSQALLLQKIEELTLYLIQQQRQLEALRHKVQSRSNHR